MTKRLKFMILGSIFLLLIAGSLFLWMNQPVSTKAKVTQPNSSINAEVDKAVPIDTAYFSTTIPPGYTIRTQNEQSSGSQMIQIFSASKEGGGQLAITMGKLPTDGLTGVSDYTYRLKNPDLYTNTEFAGLPPEAISFFGQKSDNEITIFWPHLDFYAVISISGAMQQKNSLNNAMQSVIEQWRWK